MRWRIMLELAGPDGTPQRHEVSSGEHMPTGHTAATRGLSLEEGKAVLAAVQRHPAAAFPSGVGRPFAKRRDASRYCLVDTRVEDNRGYRGRKGTVRAVSARRPQPAGDDRACVR